MASNKEEQERIYLKHEKRGKWGIYPIV